MNTIFLINKMNKINSIQTDKIEEVYQICKEEKFRDIFNQKINIFILIIVGIIDLIAYSFYGIATAELKQKNIQTIDI